MMTPAQMDGAYAALATADAAADAEALASIGWRLYGELDLAMSRANGYAALLAGLAAAARASVAAAAQDTADPLGWIRRFLRERGWLPEPGLSIAAVLASTRPLPSLPPPGVLPGPAGAVAGEEPCPGCGTGGAASPCVFCGHLNDPGCGYGTEHTPPAPGEPGKWRCTGCRAILADETADAGAAW